MTDLIFILPLTELVASHENGNTFLAANCVENKEYVENTQNAVGSKRNGHVHAPLCAKMYKKCMK